MKLTRLYSNKPETFDRIDFASGLSVILAEIKRPENQGETVHNLGKSTVARLVDFCLLKGRHPSFFLFAHESKFEGFIFYLEAELDDGRFLTISRSLESREPISILISNKSVYDATTVPPEDWSHLGLGFAPAKRLLDGVLGFDVVSPYNYRDLMGYVLREQDDYGDVFHLDKFRGKQREWKPFLAHLLGLDASLGVALYDEQDKEEQLVARIEHHRREGGATDDSDIARIDGLIAIRQRDLRRTEDTLDKFDFSYVDAETNSELVDEVEQQIARLNEEEYRLLQLQHKLEESLEEDSILFSPKDTAKLFEEAGVAFGGQIKKDFDQLVAFNKRISEERRTYLVQELALVTSRLAEVGPEIADLQARRAALFEFLENSDTIVKYKEVSARLVDLKADLASLKRQREALSQIVHLRQEQRQITERRNHLQTAIELDLQANSDNAQSIYREIQGYFDEIVHFVFGEHALLTVSVSTSGSLDFVADIVDSDGASTSQSRGFTAKKLLCIAFDLAVLRTYLDRPFPRFAFHDGVFESLETRAKQRLIKVLRDYAALGMQPVITSLDSDLPKGLGTPEPVFTEDEVIRRLSDEGDTGRLFRMSSF